MVLQDIARSEEITGGTFGRGSAAPTAVSILRGHTGLCPRYLTSARYHAYKLATFQSLDADAQTLYATGSVFLKL